MDYFKDIKGMVDGLFGLNKGEWVKRKNLSPETIETCDGEAKEDTKTKTCAKCVALNQTVFKNDNKPDYYHYNCKCEEEPYDLIDITQDFPLKKVTDYLFVNKDKKAMMNSMGYFIEDSEYIYRFLQQVIRDEFLKGNYKLQVLDIHGQHITIYLNIKGVRDHKNENFKCHIGCVAWPYGKIKVATPLIQDKKEIA